VRADHLGDPRLARRRAHRLLQLGTRLQQRLASGAHAPQKGLAELLQRYCAAAHAQTGSYLETARRLGRDRRTVRIKVSAWKRRTRNSTPN
jgi:hypothetical protein